MFLDPEITYLKSQLVMRIATVSKKGRPNVATVGFEIADQRLYTSARDKGWFRKTPRYKNVKNGRNLVALTVDDVVSVDPWRSRGIRVNGWADIVEHEGYEGKGEYIRITPKVSWSWGIPGLKDNIRGQTKTVHA